MRLLLLAFALLVLAACGSDPDAASDAMYPTDDLSYAASPADSYAASPSADARPASGDARRVTIMDRGLQMPMGTQVIPAGWTFTQDYATDPNTGQLARHTLDLRGPNGELMRNLGMQHYGQMVGIDFQNAWQQLATRGLQGEIAGVRFGALQASTTMKRQRHYQTIQQKAQERGLRVEALEAPVHGQRQGQELRGFVYLWRFTSPQMPQMGTVQASLLLSPADRLQETLAVSQRSSDSFQPNPQHEQRLAQVHQVVMQRQHARNQQRSANAWAQHRQRMADRQAQFNAHQQRMQQNSALADQQYQSWRGMQQSGDEMHRRSINGIHGTVDIYDPQMGQTYYGVEGGHDSYWTDPMGNVVGTEGYDNPDVFRYNEATNLDNPDGRW